MTIPECTCLTNHFLLAMPGLQDTMFAGSLTYMFEHSEQGAAGLVVNKSLDMSMREIFSQLDMPTDNGKADDPIMAGGPVSSHQGFVIHNAGEWSQTLAVEDGMCISTSLDILRALAVDKGPAEAVIALGYAGWGPGQLEQEIADNAWLTLEANPKDIFSAPAADRANVAADHLGVDISKLGLYAGRA